MHEAPVVPAGGRLRSSSGPDEEGREGEDVGGPGGGVPVHHRADAGDGGEADRPDAGGRADPGERDGMAEGVHRHRAGDPGRRAESGRRRRGAFQATGDPLFGGFRRGLRDGAHGVPADEGAAGGPFAGEIGGEARAPVRRIAEREDDGARDGGGVSRRPLRLEPAPNMPAPGQGRAVVGAP